MTMTRSRRLALGALAVALLTNAAACGSSSSGSKHSGTTKPTGSQPLVGTFRITAGACTAGGPTGSYLRMVFPGGGIEQGKFFENPDSACTDKTYTVVQPGTDGGLVTGTYQPQPNPAFDAQGNALAARIIKPQAFTAITFSVSTNPVDPQSGHATTKATISVDGGKLSGTIDALTASWNKQQFSQGSPKPDGSRPGLTRPISGTYDATTHAFVLDWTSQVVGGPFNDFTGVWHLVGTFQPS